MVAATHDIAAPIVDLEPRSTYEVLTREKVEHIAEELADIRQRIDTIFYVVIGSVLMDVLMRWL